MAGRKPRARTRRREEERAARRLVELRDRLVALEPGGSPDRPLEVEASPLVEVRARSERCARCGGELVIDEHVAVTAAGKSLRVAHTTCRMCAHKRSIYFRLVPRLPS